MSQIYGDLVSRSSIQNLLIPGLAAISIDSLMWTSLWKEYYSQHTSDKAAEIEIEMMMLGAGMKFPEAGQIPLSTMRQLFQSVYNHVFVGISYVMTRAAIRDNLYEDRFPASVDAMYNALDTTKNVQAASVLNYAFVSNGGGNNTTGGDGQPLCSASHPTGDGTYSNVTTPSGLNEGTLETAVITVQSLVNASNLPINLTPQKLHVPIQQQFNAERIIGSKFQPESGINSLNPIHAKGYVSQGYLVDIFLNSTTAWFLHTNEANGLKYYMRDPLEFNSYEEPGTANLILNAMERYSFGFTNARAVVGSPGVS